MGNQVASELIAARTEKLFFYSPYNFLRSLDSERQQELFGTGHAAQFLTQPNQQLFESEAEGNTIQFLYTHLSWDSEFFELPVYKLFTVLFAASVTVGQLARAAQEFRAQLGRQGRFYLFTDVPVEDNLLSQALSRAGWHLVETRLTYFHDAVATFDAPRYPVRQARPDEAAQVGQVSAQARNVYDRFHAEDFFTLAQGDAFLARYASAAVEGYQDAVLVPDEPGLPLDSFLAINDLQEHRQQFGTGLARIALTAVGPANRGWHLKLVSETLQRAREQGVSYLLMTTQATNRAVFRTCDKLNFKVGSCTHILACAGSN